MPYVFGGASPSGFDCSGLTMYVYAQFGISLPHSSAAQGSGGTRVSNPVPGDLVIIDGGSHVGIYTGGGNMIDAPMPGRVVNERPIYKRTTTSCGTDPFPSTTSRNGRSPAAVPLSSRAGEKGRDNRGVRLYARITHPAIPRPTGSAAETLSLDPRSLPDVPGCGGHRLPNAQEVSC